MIMRFSIKAEKFHLLNFEPLINPNKIAATFQKVGEKSKPLGFSSNSSSKNCIFKLLKNQKSSVDI